MTHEQVEQLWNVLGIIGGELDEPLHGPALDWLIMHRFVESGANGHRLTDKGWHAYTVMESGDGEVAEIGELSAG